MFTDTDIGVIDIPFAPLMESGAKPSLRAGTPLRGWVSTFCIHLMWIQTYRLRKAGETGYGNI